MTQTADIIIIGGGVMGASIAYHLAQRGAGRVVLIERGALCSGTTSLSGAIVRQHYSNDFTVRMAGESLRVFQHFNEQVGGECGFTTTGLLVLSDEQGAQALRANVGLQQGQGVNTRLIDVADIPQVAPGFSSEDVALACYEADCGVADPVATTHCFARRAQEQGAIIQEGVTVSRILTQRGRVSGVVTSQGEITAPVVVLAANVWSVALAREMGIELPITATRHPMVALHRPGDANEYTQMHAVCFDSTLGTYLRPDLGGITLVGAVANVLAASDPDHYPRGLSDEEIAHLSSAGAKHFPALARAVARGGWSGIYDDTPDYHPILGRLPAYDGLYCAVGFSGHGFKLSPTIGAWLAETILSGSTPADMQHFAYERFAQGKLIQPRYASGVLG